MPDLILKNKGARTVIRRHPAHIPASTDYTPAPTTKVQGTALPHLSNTDYAALVQSLSPLTITRDQAALLQALLQYKPMSLDDESKRQASLRELILHL